MTTTFCFGKIQTELEHPLCVPWTWAEVACVLENVLFLHVQRRQDYRNSRSFSQLPTSRNLRKRRYLEKAFTSQEERKTQRITQVRLPALLGTEGGSSTEHFIVHENIYEAPRKLFENWSKHIIKVALYLLNPSPVWDAWLPGSQSPSQLLVATEPNSSCRATQLQFKDENKIPNFWDKASWWKTRHRGLDT